MHAFAGWGASRLAVKLTGAPDRGKERSHVSCMSVPSDGTCRNVIQGRGVLFTLSKVCRNRFVYPTTKSHC